MKEELSEHIAIVALNLVRNLRLNFTASINLIIYFKGTVVMLGISGVLASSSMGWPSIFYFSGVAGLVWSILWFFYGSSSPADCRGRISSEERQFIETSLNTTGDSRVSD